MSDDQKPGDAPSAKPSGAPSEAPSEALGPVAFFEKLSLWERTGVVIGFLVMSWLVVGAIVVFVINR
ncbi:MAG: hypothetical protein QM667_04230 [Asticcacaulis sp.]